MAKETGAKRKKIRKRDIRYNILNYYIAIAIAGAMFLMFLFILVF